MENTSAAGRRQGQIGVAVGLTLALGWAFWPTLRLMAERWATDPRYSHGYLVPLFSLYLLWVRRGRPGTGASDGVWLGVPVLLAGLAARAAATLLYFDWLAGVALLPCVAGLALLVGGRPALARAWPAILFLAFMVPLPFRVETALAQPLQRVATVASRYALETLGFLAISEGNTIRMGTVRLGVVEACSGLSMMLIFFALATATAIVVRRPWYDKAVLVLSAVPIAVAANVTRITVTGVLHKTVGSELAEFVFHDLAGWLMMPMALAMLWVEMRLLSWVIKDAPSRRNLAVLAPVQVRRPAAAASQPPPSGPTATPERVGRA
jgi:exosortase